MDGMESFFRRPSFPDLRRAAIRGPVIILNINTSDSHVLIIRADHHPIFIRLSSAADASEIERLVRVLSGVLAFDPSPEYDQRRRGEIAEVLETLWLAIVEPVVRALDVAISPSATTKRKMRIWWVPSGDLWKLPLHAAGIYQSGGTKLSDRFISSYTPSLSALIRSLDSHQESPSRHQTQLLVVAVPNANGEKELFHIPNELKAIKDAATATHTPVLTLEDSNAMEKNVLLNMKEHSWAHFSCHGKQDDEVPFESCFKVQGRPLRLIQIVQEEMPNAELAFLAACHSAAGDRKRPNEAFHLAAGMQFAGFQSVVGTMWAMADEDAPLLSETFYKYMFRKKDQVDYRDSAVALSKAINALRRKGVPFERWINFVHYGV
jgi:CHAT domain-containing protein